MINLIIFLLSTTGIVMIVTKSTLFKPLRMWASSRYCNRSNSLLMESVGDAKSKSMFLFFWKWLDSITNCPMCLSPYVGATCAAIIYLSLQHPVLIYALLAFSCVPVSTLIIQYYSKELRGE